MAAFRKDQVTLIQTKGERSDSGQLAAAYLLVTAAAAWAVVLAASSELWFERALPGLTFVILTMGLLGGMARYSVAQPRAMLLSVTGAMAVAAGFFLTVLGVPIVIAGTLWIRVAARRGHPFVLEFRLLGLLAIWAATFIVAFLLNDDPLCIEEGVTWCTSDYVTWREAAVAALIAMGAVVLAVTIFSEAEGASTPVRSNPVVGADGDWD